MATSYEIIILKQVYYFIIAKSYADRKSKDDLIIDFFRALHEGDPGDFVAEPFKILGSFGDKKYIDLKSSPDFKQMDNFIEWALNEIKH